VSAAGLRAQPSDSNAITFDDRDISPPVSTRRECAEHQVHRAGGITRNKPQQNQSARRGEFGSTSKVAETLVERENDALIACRKGHDLLV